MSPLSPPFVSLQSQANQYNARDELLSSTDGMGNITTVWL